MRRIALSVFLLLAGGAFFLFAGGASEGPKKPRYWVELDNAFGLIKGGDLKVAGVRAGKVVDLKLDKKTNHALVQVQVNDTGFGSLRSDVFCESRPQSLIGEYFVDCLPGTANQSLKEGTTIPISHTGSTVAPDLVNDIMRKPYRERLRIILSELGAGVAGNAQNLNDAIRRANPALRETDKVLKILGRQSKVLGELAENSDAVVTDLANNRVDVQRWVEEAKDTSVASAERRDDIAAGFRRLPGFLEQLKPTMAALGDLADEQTPALRDLNASAEQLNTFFKQLTPFSEASRPAFKKLGSAARAGDDAVKKARETVTILRQFTTGAPELAKNLAIILEHLDSTDFIPQKDPRSKTIPPGRGYTGLEALLSYVYDQVLSVNVYDAHVHILKVSLIPGSPCAPYTDAEQAKADKALVDQCSSTLGPNQPGINYPDPNPVPFDTPAAKKSGRAEKSSTDAAGPTAASADVITRALATLPRLSPPPSEHSEAAPARTRRAVSQTTQLRLLDYLLSP
jgi:phospholipid/cholesterol/gamma-HCH transport system substrate-binding protein